VVLTIFVVPSAYLMVYGRREQPDSSSATLAEGVR